MPDYGLAEDHNFNAGFDFVLRDYDETFAQERWWHNLPGAEEGRKMAEEDFRNGEFEDENESI